MATTTITGTINGVNNTALANKWITFRLVQLGTDSVATATVAQSVDSVQTDANGDFSIGVWNNGDSGKPSVLEITIDGSKAESVIIPTATATIELWDLIENYQADGSTSEQVPLVSSLFVRKSNNLSDLGSATTARTNLGVAIGTNVQAHSAVLDATTASFTTADEIKLDGVEALADVTDATNIAASGGYVAGGTDVALTDGGTGASDAPAARTNLGVSIGTDVQAHSAVLDATTASFTVAEESKLSGIEALAEVNDPTTVLDADIGSTVQAYSAILDATTASFTTAKDTAISTNTANIASNDTDIATNVTNIAINATGIATNVMAIALNTAKVTNATHTGDVIGDTALTIATDAVDIPMLSASGTPSATSFLRGDNTWSVPVSGNTAVEYPYTTDFQSGVSQTRDLGVLDNLSGYSGITALTSVYIGSKVLSIGASTFSSCTGLVDAIIPSSVTIIGTSAFGGCTSLTGITIPDPVTSIGNSAFYNCSNAAFTSINIPDSVTFVGSQAFQSCTGLTSLTIGNSVNSIGNDTFRSCTSLTSTNIPDSVTSIGNGAFQSCTILATVACSVNKSIIDAATTPFLGTASPLTLNVPTGTTGWTAGTGQSIGGNTNVTVNLI